jgi:TetR/AcrR family transcriptional regulator, lmrAB and yxaGH operons repressor
MDTKTRFLQASRQLFQRQGYHGTGLNQILELSKAPKGSFYHHFPEGKIQLAAESLELAGAELEALIRNVISHANDPQTAITVFVNKVAKWFKSSDYSAGCPITSVLLDTVPDEQLTTRSCRYVFAQWIGIWSDYFESSGVSTVDAQYLANCLVTGLEGAWIVSRAMQSLDAFKFVERSLISQWQQVNGDRK